MSAYGSHARLRSLSWNSRLHLRPLSLRPTNVDRRADQREMRESLRKISQQLSGGRLDLLGEQTHIVGVTRDALEQLARFVECTAEREVVHEPERTQREGRLTARQAVIGAVPIHEPVGCQLLPDAFDGGADPRIGGRKESDERNDQRVLGNRPVVL